MKVVAISVVRDETDIVAATVGHMQTQVDHVIVADNGSTDGTRDILVGLGVEVVDDPDPAWYQGRKMSALAALAIERGARWVVPFDADEWWIGPGGERVADCLDRHDFDYGIVKAELFDHVATGGDVSEADEPDPTRRLVWRRQGPLPLHKVACRAVEGLCIEDGNHWARLPVPARFPDWASLVVHHFPHRSVEQFVRKARKGARALAATDLPPEVGAHWRQWGELSDEQLAEVFFTYYWRADPTVRVRIGRERQPPLVHDPVR